MHYNKIYDAIEARNTRKTNKLLEQYRRDKTLLTNLDINDLFGVVCQYGDLQSAQTLLEFGANIDGKDTNSGSTALVAATAYGSENVVRWLLGSHANPNIPTIQGTTALHFAITSRHAAPQTNQRIAKLLIDAHADIDARNGDGFTPLMLAAVHCDEDMVRLLINNGASKHIRERSGMTAYELVIYFINALGYASPMELARFQMMGIVLDENKLRRIARLL